ncbi:MAG: hypothetical protein C0514_00040 [Candidatus Puniceispirillum sp.]|nr:hypothetical protein [Candidatus Puniceispirillum sp.]
MLWCLLRMTSLMASAQGDHDAWEKLPTYKAGLLEITSITGPDMEDWVGVSSQEPKKEYADAFIVIRDFMAETVFMRRDELLYREKHGLYTHVTCHTRDSVVVSHTHTPYAVRVEDGFISFLQERVRQKNIAFMTDLWRMALGEPWISTRDGPLALRRLMLILGTNEVDLSKVDVPFTLLESLKTVTGAHINLSASPHDKAKRAALSLAAARVFVWAKAYEKEHSGKWGSAGPGLFAIQRSATFPLMHKGARDVLFG